jgi:hypothetical protein
MNSPASHAKITVATKEPLPLDRLSSADSGTSSVRITNSAWGGSAGNSPLEEWQKRMDPHAMLEQSNRLAQQIVAWDATERAAGNPWFGTSFQRGALDRVVAGSGTHWREWIAPLVNNEPQSGRLLAICRGFYEKLCVALLSHAPADGLVLFRAIGRHPNVRITDGSLDLPVLWLDVFAAPDSPDVKGLLNELIDGAINDRDLFEFALLAQHGGRGGWLRAQTDEWLASDWEYDQARALTLLGFSSRAQDGQALQEWIATHGDSWLKNVAQTAAGRAQRHDWARTWFKRFLEREDRCDAWAAFRLFLRCADRRALLWLDDVGLKSAERWKQEAFRFNLGTVMSACRANEKDGTNGWQHRFIGHKVKPDEYWPWMGRYVN